MHVIAVFVAQTKGIKFYHLRASGAGRGDQVYLVRRPDNAYDATVPSNGNFTSPRVEYVLWLWSMYCG